MKKKNATLIIFGVIAAIVGVCGIIIAKVRKHNKTAVS